LIVGIDNGLDGGLCAISLFDGGVISKMAMPTIMVGEKREIDTREIKEWLLYLNTPFHLAIEEPLAHAKSSQAMRSMALSFGKLIGMAETNNYEVQRVAVHKWQKRILGKISRGTSKQVAFEKAEERVPDEQWLKNSRCRVPHDGMVDAFLIARYFWETKKN
jgi:hypothetical protein|tara:strand:+ start:801 stop:1286 length:486 start_codon:yes stop_codon:yes gene_type:complete